MARPHLCRDGGSLCPPSRCPSLLLAGPGLTSSGDLKSAPQNKASPPRNASTHPTKEVTAQHIWAFLLRPSRGRQRGQGAVSMRLLLSGLGDTLSTPSRSLSDLDSSQILGLFPLLMSPAQTKAFTYLPGTLQTKVKSRPIQTPLSGVCTGMGNTLNPPSRYLFICTPGKA